MGPPRGGGLVRSPGTMGVAKKPCIETGCSVPAENGSRCTLHARERDAQRGSRQQRGYDADHERIRATLVRLWLLALRRGEVWYCPRCNLPLERGQLVEADHYGETLFENLKAKADRLSHRRCNRGARRKEPGPP